jgi:hypothetical protein
MHDVGLRINEIRSHHEDRLQAVWQALDEPRTVAEIADRLFPSAAGFHRLLALEEAGAHIEYLLSHGRIRRSGGGGRNPVWLFQRRAVRSEQREEFLVHSHGRG